MRYTPASNYAGEDSFTYAASDGLVESAPVTVAVTVTPVNDPPTTVDDSLETEEDSSVVFVPESFLAKVIGE